LSSTYLLISHGSRDPRPQQGMEKLAELVRAQLATQDTLWTHRLSDRQTSLQAKRFSQLPEAEKTARRAMLLSSAWYPLVGTATLELADAPLHEQIRQFASVTLSAGCDRLQLLPLFLLPGVHVMEDIPREVTLALASLGQAVVINQQPHLGAHPDLGRMLASQQAMVDADAKILLSHGTRRVGGNAPVEAVAAGLGAVAAYWSVKPTLEEQLFVLAGAGHKRIAILPYFLFSGGITDAIAQKVVGLQEQFPELELRLGEPIGASAELANLIVDLVEDR